MCVRARVRALRAWVRLVGACVRGWVLEVGGSGMPRGVEWALYGHTTELHCLLATVYLRRSGGHACGRTPTAVNTAVVLLVFVWTVKIVVWMASARPPGALLVARPFSQGYAESDTDTGVRAL